VGPGDAIGGRHAEAAGGAADRHEDATAEADSAEEVVVVAAVGVELLQVTPGLTVGARDATRAVAHRHQPGRACVEDSGVGHSRISASGIRHSGIDTRIDRRRSRIDLEAGVGGKNGAAAGAPQEQQHGPHHPTHA
jgi:hypothetical protein